MYKELVGNLTDDQAKLFVGILMMIGVLGGAVITALVTWWIARTNRNAATKSEYRKLAIQAGLENWRHQNTLKIDMIKSGGKGAVHIDAPDSYISHMLRVLNIATDMKLTPSAAADRITLWSRGEITSYGKPRNPQPQENPNE
jgi:hypothetical protein